MRHVDIESLTSDFNGKESRDVKSDAGGLPCFLQIKRDNDGGSFLRRCGRDRSAASNGE